jgi:hypothetical protein
MVVVVVVFVRSQNPISRFLYFRAASSITTWVFDDEFAVKGCFTPVNHYLRYDLSASAWCHITLPIRCTFNSHFLFLKSSVLIIKLDGAVRFRGLVDYCSSSKLNE